jgi:hypothetical protein
MSISKQHWPRELVEFSNHENISPSLWYPMLPLPEDVLDKQPSSKHS